jgi:PilZ domain
MKGMTFPTRVNLFVNTIWDALMEEEKPSTKSHHRKETPKTRRTRPERKDLFVYTQLIDNDTLDIVGHLSDISSGGFKLDSRNPIPNNKEFRFLMNLTSAQADKSFMEFVACSRWCRVDPLDPFVYNVGFQMVQIAPDDLEIFNRMMDKYGREPENRLIDLRRSNKW